MIRAAKLLNTTVKDLATWDDGEYWSDWALISEKADGLVQEQMTLHPEKFKNRR